MIKLFRNLRHRLLAENKLRRYVLYAIGEIILVVIGILIALSIGNWNEKSKQHLEEIRLLKKISQDLKSDINQLNGHINDAVKRQQKVDSLILLLYNDQNPTTNEFISLNVQAIGFENHFEVNSGTFDESQSAGSIKFIQNDSLREQLFTYYRIAKRNYDDNNTVQLIYRDIFPTLFKKLMATKESVLLFRGVETTLPEMDIAALREDKEYTAMLLYKGTSEQYQISSWKSYKQKAELLLINIQEELEETNSN